MQTDRYVGIGILVIGAILFWRTFAFRVLEWEPLGMAFWPRALLVMLGALALYLVLRGRLEAALAEPLKSRALLSLAGGVVYVLAMPYVGFLLLTPPFLFTAVLLLAPARGARTVLQAALTSAVGTTAVYLAFHGGLKVQLPPGLLG